MSRQIKQISMALFDVLLEEAQRIHAENDEPIPSLNNDSRRKMESCLSAPFQTFGGRPVLPGFYPKAAALFYYIVKGHPLANGNKRMACLVTFYLCSINRRMISLNDVELVKLSKYVANSNPADKDQVEQYIQKVLRSRAKIIPRLLASYKRK